LPSAAQRGGHALPRSCCFRSTLDRRLTFVIENSAPSAIDILKLDLAVFDREGTIQRRMVVEMGPVHAMKTIVRTFNVETDCGQIGAVLLNEVTACAPGSRLLALIG
jgi:hypothetical protein